MSIKKTILVLADRNPGHFRQSDGVVLALRRYFDLKVIKVNTPSFGAVFNRVLYFLSVLGFSKIILVYIYKIKLEECKEVDIIVSAGGATIVPNVLIAKLLSKDNIFCGTTKKYNAKLFKLVLSPYKLKAQICNVINTLKPSPINPDELITPATNIARSDIMKQSDKENVGPFIFTLTVLIGGPTEYFKFLSQDYIAMLKALKRFASELRIVINFVTSRRTPGYLYSLKEFIDLSDFENFKLVDFRKSGSGSIEQSFNCDALIVTSDSMSMVTEAVISRRPTVVIVPENKSHHPDFDVIKEFENNGWLALLNAQEFTPEIFFHVTSKVRPLEFNHLDNLADIIIKNLYH